MLQVGTSRHQITISFSEMTVRKAVFITKTFRSLQLPAIALDSRFIIALREVT